MLQVYVERRELAREAVGERERCGWDTSPTVTLSGAKGLGRRHLYGVGPANCRLDSLPSGTQNDSQLHPSSRPPVSAGLPLSTDTSSRPVSWPNSAAAASGSRHHLKPDAEEAPPHPAVLQERLHDPTDRGDRHRDAAAAQRRRGVDAQHLSRRGHQGPTREAGVHGRVVLEVPVDLAARGRAPALAQGAEDSQGRLHGLARSAQCQRQVADAYVVERGPLGRRQAARLYP